MDAADGAWVPETDYNYMNFLTPEDDVLLMKTTAYMGGRVAYVAGLSLEQAIDQGRELTPDEKLEQHETVERRFNVFKDAVARHKADPTNSPIEDFDLAEKAVQHLRAYLIAVEERATGESSRLEVEEDEEMDIG